MDSILADNGQHQAFVPGFQEDIFISYGHIDNQQEQWVSKLHARLQAEVQEILGDSVRFWRDKKLGGADILDATLRRRISSSAVFLPILSPRYVAPSSYCRKELEWFIQDAWQTGGLNIGTKSRVMLVLKYPPPGFPPEITQLQQSVRTDFCDKHPESGVPFTYPADEGLPGFNNFYQTYKKLARDISELLQVLKAARISMTVPSQSKTIFIAAVATDRKTERMNVVNYLKGKGYNVSGQEQPPASKSELIDWIDRELSSACMAIHLVGRNFGTIPEQEETEKKKSLAWLQYEHVRQSGKRQLICTLPPAELGEIIPEQREFLAILEQIGDSQTEIWRTSTSEFFDSLPDELAKLDRQSKPRDRGVYLICERGDLSREQLKAIRAFLAGEGFPVIQPAFQGDAAMLRDLETESVASHDATVIYYGSAPDAWVLFKRRAVLKVLENMKDPSRLPARALYLGEPPDDVKSNMYLEYAGKAMPDETARFGPLWVLGNCDQFQPEQMRPLLEILRRNL